MTRALSRRSKALGFWHYTLIYFFISSFFSALVSGLGIMAKIETGNVGPMIFSVSLVVFIPCLAMIFFIIGKQFGENIRYN